MVQTRNNLNRTWRGQRWWLWPSFGSTQGWPARRLSGVLQTFIRPVAVQSECPDLADHEPMQAIPIADVHTKLAPRLSGRFGQGAGIRIELLNGGSTPSGRPE